MLQYHKEKNMLLAMQLIINSDIQIQIIAAVTGYECASKFAANFKKRFAKSLQSLGDCISIVCVFLFLLDIL